LSAEALQNAAQFIVENVVLAPSWVYQWPQRAARRRRRTTMTLQRMDNVARGHHRRAGRNVYAEQPTATE
jgi:hypothetical protein